MEGQSIHFSLEVEDAGWENRAFGKVVNAQVNFRPSSFELMAVHSNFMIPST